jgi:hypothetical protein
MKPDLLYLYASEFAAGSLVAGARPIPLNRRDVVFATACAFGRFAAFSLTACRFARVSARAALAFAVLLTARMADRFVPVPVDS